MVAKSGRSKSQDMLAELVQRTFPNMTVRQEVPIGLIIDMSGYSVDELAIELRHKVHSMHVDVFATDSVKSVAFEYQGEQHYRSVGKMNANANAVRWDQALDEEKAWVLQRVGVPIVQIAYDERTDGAIISHLVDRATDETLLFQSKLDTCQKCHRRFPHGRLCDGCCDECLSEAEADGGEHDDHTPRAQVSAVGQRRAKYGRIRPDYDMERKEEEKRLRKALREAYKTSPEYQHRKEEWRRIRKERYKEAKEREWLRRQENNGK